ncbi:hypothetical protein [Actinosynnema mirum]|uniref:Uncharacterized protein n=1 Tax=Actinosynnema mirum (strain ATCC 29888 / DSM 43827 / JCM 3225 / NBRC 14064 / NCIMB 13271 / NRRL B-12336 / IMRU 3971 / 101) TaxID=446462 RepID=C6WB94_ACTMD|nr:hypothetical protein [Actinosynnema mirum]ACU39385.1 hypothetical protein Amir_5567 [Actinosynnema mirum DSM 43827]
MTNTLTTAPIRIIGSAAADIARHVTTYVRPNRGWAEVQVMRDECRYGCKLYVRRRGCVLQYALIHSCTYGCPLGCDPATRVVPVSVAPAAENSDRRLDALGGRDNDRPAELADDQLDALLLAWRDEADSVPVAELVSTDAALAVIAGARDGSA